jgi:dihydrofolate reductase
MERRRAPGRAGEMLPWRLPDDLRRFKAITTGRPVVMGHRTAVSIGRALPGRDNVVLSRARPAPFPGQRVARGLDEALAGLSGEVIVGGGGEVYALTLPRADRLRLTWVDTEVDGPDTFFPRFDPATWTEVAREHHPADDRHQVPFDWVDYVRSG